MSMPWQVCARVPFLILHIELEDLTSGCSHEFYESPVEVLRGRKVLVDSRCDAPFIRGSIVSAPKCTLKSGVRLRRMGSSSESLPSDPTTSMVNGCCCGYSRATQRLEEAESRRKLQPRACQFLPEVTYTLRKCPLSGAYVRLPADSVASFSFRQALL